MTVMETIELNASKRNKSHSATFVRAQGKIPAEFYGRGMDNLSIEMDYQAFRKAFKAAGESTIIDLKIEGGASLKVLVHDVQYDPLSDQIRHVDFINVRMDEEVHTHIPLEFVGVSNAVKNLGGVFNAPISEVEVKCLPKYLVHSIQVDISVLEDFTHSIHVRDLVIPEGITVLNDPDLSVAAVGAPRVEEEAPAETAAPAEGAEAAAAEQKKE